jgi:hypothetical protein
MERSHFVSHFPLRAERHLPRPLRPLGLKTRLDIRPTRFPVGLEHVVLGVPGGQAGSAPANAAFYLARVKEVSGDGVVALVWECPSGREALATLSVREDFAGEPPLPGSMLKIWTWVELPGQDVRRMRRRVEGGQPQLSESERAELQAFLESLEEEDAKQGEE